MGDEEDLVEAVRKDDAVRAHTILDRTPLILRMRTPNGSLVLAAAYHGATNVLRLLLERTQEDALTLYDAAATGNARRLKTILGQSRARVNVPNLEGLTPLVLASWFGHADAVKVLLENGADVNHVDRNRGPHEQANPLEGAVAGNHLDVVRVLLGAGASPKVFGEDGHTPLHTAARHGNLEIVKLLLAHGADVTDGAGSGRTARDLAEERGHKAVVDLLTDKGTTQ